MKIYTLTKELALKVLTMIQQTSSVYAGGVIDINEENVNLRSQPNTQARIIDTVGGMLPWDSPEYLGEWTNPKGERRVIGNYLNYNKKQYIVWIYGQYTSLITSEELDRIIEAESQ